MEGIIVAIVSFALIVLILKQLMKPEKAAIETRDEIKAEYVFVDPYYEEIILALCRGIEAEETKRKLRQVKPGYSGCAK